MKQHILKIIIFLILIIPVPSWATTRYVCNNEVTCDDGALEDTTWETGTDSGNATSKGAPWLTLTYALSSSSALAAGDTLIIGKGTYSESWDVEVSGTEGNYITIQSESPWEAQLTGTSKELDNDASISYIIFKDLDMSSGTSVFNFRMGSYLKHHIQFINNKIHDNTDNLYYSSCIATNGGIGHTITFDKNEFYGCGTGPTGWTSCYNGNDGCSPGDDRPYGYALYAGGANWTISNNIFRDPADYAGPFIKMDGHDDSVADTYDPEVLVINNNFIGHSLYRDKYDWQFMWSAASGTKNNLATKTTFANNVFTDPGTNATPNPGCSDASICINSKGLGDLEPFGSDLKFYNNRSSQKVFYWDTDKYPSGGSWVDSGNEDEAEGWVDADCGFADAANDFYLLTASSDLIDEGHATYAPADDYEGTSRPQPVSGADDIGAYEYSSTSFTVCSSGANYTQATFEALSGDKSGVTYYFCDEDITSTLDISIYGTSGNPVILDGYQTDDATFANLEETIGGGRALIDCNDISTTDGIVIDTESYITIQDFEITDCDVGVYVYDSSDSGDNITVKRSFFYEGGRAAIYLGTGSQNNIIGGSSGQGVVVKNWGDDDSGASDIIMCDSNDNIISYNHLYANSASWGITGITATCETSFDILIEYNSIHDHDRSASGQKGRSGISFKNGAYNIVARYNNIYGHDNGEASGGNQVHIASANPWVSQYIYVYGNRIATGRTGIYWDYDSDDIYIFSNIIENNIDTRGIAAGGSAADSNDIYIFNNTFAGNVTTPSVAMDSHMYIWTNDGLILKNNIFYKGRPNESDYTQYYLAATSDDNVTADYNRYYWPGQTSKIYWGDGGSLTLAQVKAGSGNGLPQEANGSEGDPDLVDIANGDYRISSSNSAVLGAGVDMGTGNIATLTINGEAVNVPWDFALGPNTDWSGGTIPVIDFRYRDDWQWDQGAYVWAESVPPFTQTVVGVDMDQ